MKTFKTIMLGLLLAALAITCHTASGATTSELLQQGLYAEEVEGNIDSAIMLGFRRAATMSPGDF